MPASTAIYTNFGKAGIDHGRVAFTALDSQHAVNFNGLYSWSSGSLSVVANTSTQMPGGAGTFVGFDSNYPPSIRGPQTAFIGGNGIEGGVYLMSGSGIVPVALISTPVPNGTSTFASMGGPWLDQGRVVFSGFEQSPTGQRGIYLWESGSLDIVADRSTPVPGGTGTFTSFVDSAIRGDSVVFTADGTGGQFGIYRSSPSGMAVLVNNQTSVPNGFPNLIGAGRVALDDTGVAFYGVSSISLEGVYTNLNGTIAAVAQSGTLIPDLPGSALTAFGSISRDGGYEVFNAAYGGAQGGEGLFTNRGGVLSTIIHSGQVLDGRMVSVVRYSSQGLSNDTAVFYVGFTDGTRALYTAAITPCYPDCNTDGQLTVADFGCFQTKFVSGDPYGDCNQDAAFTVADFGCFQTKFVTGCP